MYRTLITCFAALVGLAGWTNPAGAGLLSATGPVIAILAGDLFTGEAEGNFDGAGTIKIQSRLKPDVTCYGRFISSSELGGAGKALRLAGQDLVLADISQPGAAILPVKVSIAPALVISPDVLLSAATLVVTAKLKENRNLQTNSPEKIAELVETRLLPLFNFRHMTELAVARNWRLASPEQQDTLIAEFRTLLVRTYSTALANYSDQTIEYRPLNMAPDDTVVTVKSSVKQSGTERMTLDYDMEKTTAGWKVYDIKIGGISLITTYRSTFAATIRNAGVDGLIQSLAAKNRVPDVMLKSDQNGVSPSLFLYAVVPSILRGSR